METQYIPITNFREGWKEMGERKICNRWGNMSGREEEERVRLCPMGYDTVVELGASGSGVGSKNVFPVMLKDVKDMFCVIVDAVVVVK